MNFMSLATWSCSNQQLVVKLEEPYALHKSDKTVSELSLFFLFITDCSYRQQLKLNEFQDFSKANTV